jgi:hypothetical protein
MMDRSSQIMDRSSQMLQKQGSLRLGLSSNTWCATNLFEHMETNLHWVWWTQAEQTEMGRKLE